MTDVLIRNVSDRVLQALNLAATRQGLSRNEYLGNVLERTAHQSDTRVTTRHLKNLAHAFSAPVPDTTEPAPPEPASAEPAPATTDLAPPGVSARPTGATANSAEPATASTTTDPTELTEPTTTNPVESTASVTMNKGCSCPG